MLILSIIKQPKTLVYAAVVGILVTTHAATAWYFYSEGRDAEKIEVANAAIDQLNKNMVSLAQQQTDFNDGVVRLNTTLVEHSKTTTYINNIVEKEIEKPVYKYIGVPSSGMQLIADTASALNSKRVSGSVFGQVPASTEASAGN